MRLTAKLYGSPVERDKGISNDFEAMFEQRPVLYTGGQSRDKCIRTSDEIIHYIFAATPYQARGRQFDEIYVCSEDVDEEVIQAFEARRRHG